MKKIILPLFLLLALTGKAQMKAEDVNTFTLKNGMKVLVVEDFSIPNANMYLFYKVGSRNEYQGITGLSHFFEHMMFNAKKYGPKQFDQTMEFNGGPIMPIPLKMLPCIQIGFLPQLLLLYLISKRIAFRA
jgi:predicted Zn-dependent peptidase